MAWRDHSWYQRLFYNEKYVRYWSDAISKNEGDAKALWSKVSALLKAPTSSSSTTIYTAEDFALYFKEKVDTIRATTANATPPISETRPCIALSEMKQVRATMLSKMVANSPTKHCVLDLALSWLVKRAMPLLADTLALMCNTSITEGVFPEALKHAIVCLRLRKPTLDPTHLGSYRPISNLSFVSKTVERVVAARFSQHVDAYHPLPCHRSAYPCTPFNGDRVHCSPRQASSKHWCWKNLCPRAARPQCRPSTRRPWHSASSSQSKFRSSRFNDGLVWLVPNQPDADLSARNSSVWTTSSWLFRTSGISPRSTRVHSLHWRSGVSRPSSPPQSSSLCWRHTTDR